MVWTKPQGFAVTLRAPRLGADYAVDTEGGEEYVVAVAVAEGSGASPLALVIDVTRPAAAAAGDGAVNLRVPAAFSTAVPGVGLDVGGFASAGLLAGGSVAARPAAEGGGYLVTIELALGLSVAGVSLGQLSRVSLGKVVVPVGGAGSGAAGTTDNKIY